MKSFTDKVAAITGAGSGIGRALALNLAAQRCHLALSDINEEAVKETAAQAQKHGVKVTTARLDVSDAAAVQAWADQVVAEHGKVNMIFNNAGVSLGSTAEGVSREDFEWIMGINFWGVVYGTQAFLPHLKASGEGHVINISSLFGLLSGPGQSTYNASKFAVRGFTECLSQEMMVTRAPVGVTCVHPGGIKTNIARSARLSQDLAQRFGSGDKDPREDFEKFFITTPDTAAQVILNGVRKNKRRVLIGRDAKFLDLVVRLMPSAYQRIVVRFTGKALGRDKPAQDGPAAIS